VQKSKAEKMIGRLGFWLGLALGLAVAVGLLVHWAGTGQGSWIPNILLGLVVGAGIFLVFWTATLFWLAPRFAGRDSLRVREAVRILRYWPGDQLMELEIENDRVADSLPQAPALEECVCSDSFPAENRQLISCVRQSGCRPVSRRPSA
jgi:hypothetical protein